MSLLCDFLYSLIALNVWASDYGSDTIYWTQMFNGHKSNVATSEVVP